MKKFRRILGRCALGAFLLAAVYSILVAAGVLLPAPPVVPAGPMFVPELSQEQEERFAEQKKRYGTLFLTVSSAKPFTVTNHAGDTARVDPRGDVTGDLKVYQANRYEPPLDGRIYTVGIEVCGSEEIIVDLERQQGRIDWTWEEGGGEGELSCCVNGPAMERVRIYPDRRLQIADTHRRGRAYTVSFTNHYRMYELGVRCAARIRGQQQLAFPRWGTVLLEGETAEWQLIYVDSPLEYPEEWTVPTPKAKISVDPWWTNGAYFRVTEGA